MMPNPSRPSVLVQILLAFVYAVLIVGVGLFALGLWWFHGPAQDSRQSSCASNLKQLALAAQSYAADYDGRLPLKPHPGGDWMAAQWGAFPITVYWHHGYHLTAPHGGPLWDYAKNCCICMCPNDPSHFRSDFKDHPRSSYDWNYALCGKLLEQQKAQPLVWDREPWHRGQRNVAYGEGGVRLVR
jgi:hypothetical protein